MAVCNKHFLNFVILVAFYKKHPFHFVVFGAYCNKVLSQFVMNFNICIFYEVFLSIEPYSYQLSRILIN